MPNRFNDAFYVVSAGSLSFKTPLHIHVQHAPTLRRRGALTICGRQSVSKAEDLQLVRNPLCEECTQGLEKYEVRSA